MAAETFWLANMPVLASLCARTRKQAQADAARAACAPAADILDLLEYTRARRGGLFRTLLEQAETTLDVQVDLPSTEPRPATIEEEAGEPPRSFIIRDAETDLTLGRIPTSLHADVEAVLQTGLPLTGEFQLATLTLRLVEE